jgi:metal-dependent HD superfamily phosphatase/phosphodiesterase
MYSSFNQANLTASTKTANILSGDINEFITSPSVINIYAVSSASGVRLSMLADSDVAIDDKEIVAIGTSLDKSQHLLDSFAVFAGTRLALTLRETAAAATTDVLLGVEVLPM